MMDLLCFKVPVFLQKPKRNKESNISSTWTKEYYMHGENMPFHLAYLSALLISKRSYSTIPYHIMLKHWKVLRFCTRKWSMYSVETAPADDCWSQKNETKPIRQKIWNIFFLWIFCTRLFLRLPTNFYTR